MSLLSAYQRSIVRTSTSIDPLIIDRVTEAFDALIDHGDIARYELLISTAIAQMGYDRPIREGDRPTAVDKVKTILIKAYADEKHISFGKAASRLRQMLRK